MQGGTGPRCGSRGPKEPVERESEAQLDARLPESSLQERQPASIGMLSVPTGTITQNVIHEDRQRVANTFHQPHHLLPYT